MASRPDHPKVRFERHLRHRWAIDPAQLDPEDRAIALLSWQTEELLNGSGNPRSRWRRAAPVVERAGPWGVVAMGIIYLIQQGG